MGFEVRPVEAAVDQLDWAIRLLLDHQAYIPAITLSGAADGILDNALRLAGETQTAHVSLIQSLSKAGYGPADEVGKCMRAAQNYLKHGRAINIDPSDIDLSNEAVHQIARAIINLYRFDQTITSETFRFLRWIEGRQ